MDDVENVNNADDPNQSNKSNASISVNVNEWSELEHKLDTALEHTTNELNQIAEIYRRLGMTEKVVEIENTIASQEKIVPILSRHAAKQSAQNQGGSHVTNFRSHQSKRSGSH